MIRPQSIVWFERFYLGALSVGLIGNAINWSSTQAQIAATPGSEILPSWFVPVMLVVGISLNLLLWYFVARRGSTVAKVIVVVIFAFGLLGLPQLFTGAVTMMMGIFAVIGIALNAAAVWMLFRPDTKPWFSGGRPDLEDTFR